MTIVTKTGDKGQTGLFGGKRIPKDYARIHAYGTVDELNAAIGVALAEEGFSRETRANLTRLQHLLFRVGGDLATPLATRAKQDRIGSSHVTEIDVWIFSLEALLPPQTQFILPGGNRRASLLHLARTVCRRAERWVVTLEKQEEINHDVLVFLNRLSDFLFLAARQAAIEEGGEVTVRY
ncbi:cob(I)yrinic acid a,c-diamide adenosyltransferase [Candidatus Peregrinibacteria bacterium]|nr:cob(I)yrinic acid a,c-diamide adenosyltransferase [Candidatus Peregrinibacteria bacterium]MBI3816582.1 cob(I)yrinic acid a,c-diamide adenosyltransferase [Candidatus Peregrinibacteria bacterium]